MGTQLQKAVEEIQIQTAKFTQIAENIKSLIEVNSQIPGLIEEIMKLKGIVEELKQKDEADMEEKRRFMIEIAAYLSDIKKNTTTLSNRRS